MKDYIPQIFTTLITVVVAMMAFWMVEARSYINRTECLEIVVTQSPYAKDKTLIMSELSRASEGNRELKQSVDNTNQVLSQLRVEMAVLNRTLQYIIDKDKEREIQSRNSRSAFDAINTQANME